MLSSRPESAARNARPRRRLWEVVGVREINTGPTGWTIQSSIDNTVVRLGPSDTVIRIWRGHPAYRYQADSPVRALLPILSEIKFLTLHVYAQTISRLAGAGLMVLPKSVEFPGMDKLANQAEGIQKLLGSVMAKAIANPGDPSSLVPILLRVNDESVDKVREPLHFWSPFDANASQARKEAIIRFSTGFDLPPEVISGMSANLSASGGRGTGLSHWGQWQIEESAIKMHIEPLLDVITNGLVMSYIRPVTDEATAAIVVDSTPLKLQPDRSKDAAEAYDRGELSGEGLRYYKGLSADYVPSDDDKKYAILRKMATGSASPEMVAEAARLLGVQITPPAVNIPAPATRPNPSLIGHPVRSKPDRPPPSPSPPKRSSSAPSNGPGTGSATKASNPPTPPPTRCTNTPTSTAAPPPPRRRLVPRPHHRGWALRHRVADLRAQRLHRVAARPESPLQPRRARQIPGAGQVMRSFASTEEFTADRRAVLDDAETRLTEPVRQAIARWSRSDWTVRLQTALQIVFDQVYTAEAGHPLTDRAFAERDRLIRELADALDHTSRPGRYTEALLVRYLATAVTGKAVDAATADDPEQLVLQWVSMHDDQVRHAHQVLDGKRRHVGEPFHYGAEEIRYPGDVTAPIELWISCRCVLRADFPTDDERMPLVAAGGVADPGKNGAVVVALPKDGDPVHQMGPEPSHVTLVWLGDPAAVDAEKTNAEVAAVADSCNGECSDLVGGRGTLGPDQADVLLLDGSHLGGLRSALLDQPTIRSGHDAAHQHPVWLPHLTVGYPGEHAYAADTPAEVCFDRLALWHGDQQTEHRMGGAMTETPADEAALTAAAAPAIPWHGVLTVEGKASGDRRSFKKGALRNRELPLRLTWQRTSDNGHKGNVVVGTVEALHRHPGDGDGHNEIRAAGHFLASAEADEVVGQAAEFGNLGVSVDVDDSAFEVDQDNEQVTFSDARVCSACIVTIPAFPEAQITLGEAPDGYLGTPPTEAAVQLAIANADVFISSKPWDGSPARFSDEQYRRSCVLDRGPSAGPVKQRYGLPIREPSGELNRAAVHSAAGRIDSVKGASAGQIAAAKSKLRTAYQQIGEKAPFELVDLHRLDIEPDEFRRGPGWLTDPVATKKIHDYWTVPGQPGYEKIGWGTGGDFNRCRVEVGEEIGENSAEKLRFLNQICAQWHHDALGYWPATHAKMLGGAHGLEERTVPSPAVSLVASAGARPWPLPKAAWFGDPRLAEPTPLTYIEEDGATRVVGHLAEWSQCHLDFPGVCVTPPPLADRGDNFMIGRVETDEGPIRVGCLTLGGGHADLNMGLVAARAHYDDVSTAVADVRVGEDQYGIWFAGWLRPWVEDKQRYQLLACDISGDWRDYGGQKALIAAHAVNSGGFRTKARTRVVDGVQTALVAAGGVHRTGTPSPVLLDRPGEGVGALTYRPGDLPELVSEGIRRYKETEEAAGRMGAVAQAAALPTPQQRMAALRTKGS
jgi:hypothetical protein